MCACPERHGKSGNSQGDIVRKNISSLKLALSVVGVGQNLTKKKHGSEGVGSLGQSKLMEMAGPEEKHQK